MAKCGDKEVGFSNTSELVLSIGDRLPPPGDEDVSGLLSKMQLNPGPTDSRKGTVKSTESSSHTSKG